MRNIPHHTRMQPYHRPEEAQQHRIAIEAELSQLELTLEAYRGMPPPIVVTYPNGHYEFSTEQRR